MSQRNRLGLKDLANLRKPLVQTIVGDDELVSDTGSTGEGNSEVPTMVPLEVQQIVPQSAPQEVPRILQTRRTKKRLIAQSFKLPADLDERWTRIAKFNNVTKTGILLEALETFLDRLPQPAKTEAVNSTDIPS